MDHFIKEVVNASLPGALKWDICSSLEDEAWPNCRLRNLAVFVSSGKNFPQLEGLRAISGRHLPCAGSLDGFLVVSVSWESIKIHKGGKFLLFSNSAVANRVISKLYISSREKNESNSPFLSCSLPTAKSPKNCSTTLNCEKVGR